MVMSIMKVVAISVEERKIAEVEAPRFSNVVQCGAFVPCIEAGGNLLTIVA